MKSAHICVIAIMIAGANLASAQATDQQAAQATPQTAAPSADQQNLELRACGPKAQEINFHEKADHSQHPTPQPSPGKALVYILRPSKVGLAIQAKVAVDGDWKGVTRGDTYFFFELDPGEHAVCSVAENHSVMVLTVEAGKTYYLQQHIETGILKARNKIAVMPDDEAQKKLPKLHLATFTRK